MYETDNKIGIMTMHSIPNYGAIMQAYATVEIIRKLSKREYNNYIIPEIIDYQPINKKKRYSSKAFLKDSLTSPRRFISNMLNFKDFTRYRSSRKLHKKAYEFYRTINILSGEVSKKNLQIFTDKYSALLVGSDQVWNPYGMGQDKSYLLDFCQHNKKFAFSSSFGISEFPNEFRQTYAEELSKFQRISLREKQGTQIFSMLTGRNDCIQTIDPTLFLKKDDYEKLENNKILNQIGNEYSLVYFASKSRTLADFALKNASGKRKIVFLGMPGEIPNISKKNHNIIKLEAVSPGEFLALFHHAIDIFTNSFHGIAFSIIYKKCLWIEYNNLFSKSNSRLENIVELLSLEKHIIGSKEYDKKHIIDYSKVDYILSIKQEEGENFMLQILNQICKYE